MKEFYQRQIELWGEDKQQILHTKSIAIVGCGGLGCSLAYALATSGIGKIYLIDFDKVSLNNLHRQIGFNHEDINHLKSQSLSKNLQKRIHKDTDIQYFVGTFEDFCKQNIKLDLILDATDNLTTRTQISNFANKNSLVWIYSSVEEWYGQICIFENSKFEDLFKIQKLPPKGQIAPMVMHVASFSGILALRFLCDFEVKKNYIYCLNFGGFNIKNQGFFIT